jgi:hypothetical protein
VEWNGKKANTEDKQLKLGSVCVSYIMTLSRGFPLWPPEAFFLPPLPAKLRTRVDTGAFPA